jgi:hypothetical protein
MALYRVSKKQSGGGIDLLALASAGTQTTTTPDVFNLTDAETPTTATRIPNHMFRDNYNVGEIDLADIEEVGSFSFSGGRSISKIRLASCTKIGESAFESAGVLSYLNSPIREIYLPLCKEIGASGFRNVRTTTSAQSPMVLTLTKLENLGMNAFRGNTYSWTADEIVLPAIKSIGQYAFGNQTIRVLDLGSSCTTLASQILNAATVTTLIIRATNPPALTTTLGNAPTEILVPAASVAAYKSANVWSNYSSIISAIT